MKTVLMCAFDRRQKTHGEAAICTDADIAKIKAEFESPELDKVLDNPAVKFVIIAIYIDLDGEMRRRIGGSTRYEPGDEKMAIRSMGASLGIYVNNIGEIRCGL